MSDQSSDSDYTINEQRSSPGFKRKRINKNKRKRLNKKRNRVFRDAALVEYDEELTTRVRNLRLSLEDRSSCHVNIIGPPHGYLGTCKAQISDADIENFKRYNAIKVMFFARGLVDGHALTLIRNANSGECELYDSNGDPSASFGYATACALSRALHRGLLRRLISPEPGEPVAPFSVSIQHQDIAVQINERRCCADALNSLESDETVFKHFLAVGTYNRLLDYLSKKTPGFCETWSTFRLIDNVKTSLKFFNVVNEASRDPLGTPANDLMTTATEVYYRSFCKDLLNTDIDSDLYSIDDFMKEPWIKTLFVLMVIPIVTRLLANYFVACSEKGLSFKSDELWWPSRDKTLQNFLQTLLPKGHEYFLIDLNLQASKDILFSYEGAQLLHMNHFPFPATATIGTKRAMLWECSVDTTKPLSSTTFNERYVSAEEPNYNSDATMPYTRSDVESPNLNSEPDSDHSMRGGPE